MRTQVKALLRGDIADIDGCLAQILASDGWLPDRPINVPVYMAGQGPKARALAKEITDGLISLGGPAEGFETCLVSTNGTVLDDGEDITSPRASTALKPLIALAYHFRYTTDLASVKALPNTQAEIRRSTEYPVEALMSAATPYLLRFLVGVWQLRKLRKSIGDVEPRRLACDKAVERRPHVRVVVEYAQRDTNSGWLDLLMIGEPQAPQNPR
jgi:hypothetical protein